MNQNESLDVIWIEKIKLLDYIVTVIYIIGLTPLIITDLWYGFSKDECLTIYPIHIKLNLKGYLLVSGIVQFIIILFLMYQLLTVKKSLLLTVITIVINMIYMVFMMIWNILGAVVFWNDIYKEGNCEEDISTYLFVSIIIKIILTFINMIQNKNNFLYA